MVARGVHAWGRGGTHGGMVAWSRRKRGFELLDCALRDGVNIGQGNRHAQARGGYDTAPDAEFGRMHSRSLHRAVASQLGRKASNLPTELGPGQVAKVEQASGTSKYSELMN